MGSTHSILTSSGIKRRRMVFYSCWGEDVGGFRCTVSSLERKYGEEIGGGKRLDLMKLMFLAIYSDS